MFEKLWNALMIIASVGLLLWIGYQVMALDLLDTIQTPYSP